MAKDLESVLVAVENAIEVCDEAVRAKSGRKTFDALLSHLNQAYGPNVPYAWGLILSGIAFNKYLVGEIPEDEFQAIRATLQPTVDHLLFVTQPAKGEA